MRLRPGFLKPQASPRTTYNASTRPTNDDGRGLDHGPAAAGGEGDKRHSRSSVPPRHGSCYGGGGGGGGNISGSDGRTSLGTSQSSVGSLLSARGNFSPTAGTGGGGGEEPVAKLSVRGPRGSGGSYRQRAASTPVTHSSGDRDRPPSHWNRRRRSDAVEIDPDDEVLMERRRGDGNGASDEEEEEEGGVLGRPSEESWSDGLSADLLGVRRGGDFFPGDSPAVSPAAAHDGGVIVVVGGKETAAAAKRRHGADRIDLKAPDASPDLEGETRESEGEDDDARSGSGSGGGSVRWWSRRQPPDEGAGGEGEGRWWSPLPQQPDDEDTPAWWSGRGKSSTSTGGGGAGGEDGRRWSSPSSLFAQAVSAFSAIGPAPPPAPPPAVPPGSGVSTVAAQDGGGGLAAVVGGGAGGASAGGDVSGDGGVSAEPGTAADKGGGGVQALVERPRVLLELPFFCKENGTEEMRAVLENADLRAGFKQARERERERELYFLAKRLCAENLVFVEDVMRYQEMVVGEDAEGASATVAALQLSGEIEEKYLSESSRLEVNIGDDMRKDCVAKRARDVELERASLDTFTPVVLELLSLMVHSSLPGFRGSAHYATIKACLYMGPRGTRNSGATSSLTHEDEWGAEDDEDDEDDSFEQEDF
ncbi:unnamed protein product [Ectocarpus sp. 6 AP-2014]